jgi:hypothetical protein
MLFKHRAHRDTESTEKKPRKYSLCALFFSVLSVVDPFFLGSERPPPRRLRATPGFDRRGEPLDVRELPREEPVAPGAA